MKEQLIITPKTKVLQLIEAYPQLEEVLIGYVPAFKKLQNPVLRRTVAKIANLQQAASIGNVPVGELVNKLRTAVGQDMLGETGETRYVTALPEWFNETLVEKEMDIRPILAAGDQPVSQVMADLNTLSPGKIYRLIAPFIPAPLIDKASSLSIRHYIKKVSEEMVLVYFFKQA